MDPQSPDFEGFEILHGHPNNPFVIAPRSTTFTFSIPSPDQRPITIDAVITNYDNCAHIVLTETGGLATTFKLRLEPNTSTPLISHLQGQLFHQYSFLAEKLAALIEAQTIYFSFSLKRTLQIVDLLDADDDEEITTEQFKLFHEIIATVSKYIAVDEE